jgi:succinate dehydrogenase/fumarate reductase cytochrome b subunit
MDRTLARLQALSGLVFAAFLGVHLVALFASVFGPGRYDAVQQATRVVYTSPLYEVLLLLAPLVVHIVVGVLRMRRRPDRGGRPLPRAVRWHRWSAYFLLLVIGGHVAATRGVAVFAGIEVGFAGIAFAMWWMPTLFAIYYTLLALAGLYHGAYGVAHALAVLGVPMPAMIRLQPRFTVPLATAGVLAVLGVASLVGALYPIPDPTDNPYARFYRDTLGVELPKSTP